MPPSFCAQGFEDLKQLQRFYINKYFGGGGDSKEKKK